MKEQKKLQEQWDKGCTDKQATFIDYQQQMKQIENYKKVCEDSLKSLSTKQAFYNVFVCEKIYINKNNNKLFVILIPDKHKILLAFIKYNL